MGCKFTKMQENLNYFFVRKYNSRYSVYDFLIYKSKS